MKSTQNKKINQVKETTMVVGIDVGSVKHYFELSTGEELSLQRNQFPSLIQWKDLRRLVQK